MTWDNVYPVAKTTICAHEKAQRSMRVANQWFWLCPCGAVLYNDRSYACEFRNLSAYLDSKLGQA